MKKMRNVEWGAYRHPEFLQSLTISVNELKFIRLFLKRGSVAMVNELLRERKTKQENRRVTFSFYFLFLFYDFKRRT